MKFWKPGTSFPGEEFQNDRDTQSEGGLNFVFNPNDKLSFELQRQKLPIYKYKTEILYCVEKYQVIILMAETGSGKTTQIPQYLFESGWCDNGKIVGCTQPRRMAAISVSMRVAQEKDVELGGLVGYAIRFDDKTSNSTKIKYMTDGMLLREMMSDPLLSSYSVIMVDESHERGLHTDIILGLLKKILKKRSDLKLIISSATILAKDFKKFFETNTINDPSKDTSIIVSIEGRMFPVQLYYMNQPSKSYIEAALEAIIQIDKTEKHGDVLVFMPGQEDIEMLIELINTEMEKRKLKLFPLPLYSGLNISDQMRVFQYPPKGTRKIIVSTNIAEASVTIENIVYVIDSGFVKQKMYDPKSEMERLLVMPISQSSAIQRAGRAGRTQSGKCYRLYTKEAYLNILSPQTIPEVQRSNMAPIIIQMKALGIENVEKFDFISPPSTDAVIRGHEILFCLGALDKSSQLTDPLGVQISEFPVDPKLAKMLLISGEMYCSEEALIIASMLTVQTVFSTSRNAQDRVERAKRNFAVYEGDHIMLLNIFKSFNHQNNKSQWCYDNFIDYKSMLRVLKVKQQLHYYMKKFKIEMRSCGENTEIIRKCVLSGYFTNVAQKQGDGSFYLTVRGKQKLFIHPSSSIFQYPPDWVVYSEVIQTTKAYMRDVISIDYKWLLEIAPQYYELEDTKKMKEIQQKNIEKYLD